MVADSRFPKVTSRKKEDPLGWLILSCNGRTPGRLTAPLPPQPLAEPRAGKPDAGQHAPRGGPTAALKQRTFDAVPQRRDLVLRTSAPTATAPASAGY